MIQTVLAPAMPTAIVAAAYNVADMAVLFKLSERTVWRLSDEGSIPGKFRVGGSVRWSKRVVDAWIEKGCPKTKSR
jgi:excisionase family DNA binding protein